MFKSTWLLALTALLFACSGNERYIAKSDFGSNWPFTVDAGVVSCEGEAYSVIFTVNGKSYALNDAARESGLYLDVSEILKADTNYPGQQVKMDMSNIEFEGLKLCNH